MTDLVLLNGPNLGRLGVRRPEVYGSTTLDEIEVAVRSIVEPAGFDLIALQTNHEGEAIDLLERHHDAAGALLNPGAWMMGGWSLREALDAFDPPWIEVHLTNVWARDPFRHDSLTGALADGVVMGLGAAGYEVAARALVDMVARSGR